MEDVPTTRSLPSFMSWRTKPSPIVARKRAGNSFGSTSSPVSRGTNSDVIT
jgi:hypothetical protein